MLNKTPFKDLPLLDQLEAIHDFLTPERWAQFGFAYTSSGERCLPTHDSRAVKFCAEGAIVYLCQDPRAHERVFAAIYKAIPKCYPGFQYLCEINDEKDYAAVMKVFDEAIRNEKGRP